MLSLKRYLENPCGTASIPYWKQKEIVLPEQMRIVHDSAYDPQAYADFQDEPYFRLRHDLNHIGRHTAEGIEIVSAASEIDAFVRLIHASYRDISVTAEQLSQYGQTPAYFPDGWVLMKERRTGNILAGGIADYDREAGELILEWIQVLPAYRRRGYGQLIVNHLLAATRHTAQFATVSGQVNNPTHPEGLYRKCGFTGHDVWHILTRK